VTTAQQANPLSNEAEHLESNQQPDPPIQVGILTKGKPTLGMVLASLLLQEAVQVRIHVVDTSAQPVINRPDVQFALRLAADRGLYTSYDFVGESNRAFSAGKARLIRELNGPHICLMDDDIVMPSAALAGLAAVVRDAGIYGYISPYCRNAVSPAGLPTNRPSFSPGALIYQDDVVRRILLEYYDTTVDILDRQPSEQKVWELGFLTRLFEALGRPVIRQGDIVVYHLDYHENSTWIDDERAVVSRSMALADQLAKRALAGKLRERAAAPSAPFQRRLSRRGSWIRRAQQAIRFMF